MQKNPKESIDRIRDVCPGENGKHIAHEWLFNLVNVSLKSS
jgi:hypothetical protein